MCNPIGKLAGKLANPLSLPLRLMEKNKLKPKDFATGGASLLIGGDKFKNRTVNNAAPTKPAVSRTNQYGITDNLL